MRDNAVYVAGSEFENMDPHALALARKIKRKGFRWMYSLKQDRYAQKVRNALRRLGGVKIKTKTVNDGEDLEVVSCHFLWETPYLIAVWNGDKKTIAAYAAEAGMRMSRKIIYMEA